MIPYKCHIKSHASLISTSTIVALCSLIFSCILITLAIIQCYECSLKNITLSNKSNIIICAFTLIYIKHFAFCLSVIMSDTWQYRDCSTLWIFHIYLHSISPGIIKSSFFQCVIDFIWNVFYTNMYSPVHLHFFNVWLI